MTTMNEKYGDGSDHQVCDTCGFCIPCGDCKQYGCGAGSTPDSGGGEQGQVVGEK